MTDAPSRRLGRFDRTVLLAIFSLILAILVVIWRGDRIGIQALAFMPAPGSSGVSVRTQIQVRFDQPLADGAALRLSPATPGQVRMEGETLVFVPDGALAPDTTYTVTLAAGVRSRHGRILHDPITWRFQTGRTAIVYSALDEQGREQLMRRAVRLGDGPPVLDAPRQVTQAPYGIWDFTVDPNTGQIVFAQSHEDGASDLWRLMPGAETPELLRACPQATCNSTAFAPDSRLLAFSQRNASGFAAPVVSPPRLWLLDLRDGAATQLFADSQQLGFEPRWSPDGQWLSYLSPDLGGVGVYNLETGESRFYPTTTGDPAIWHPVQNRLVLSEMIARDDVYEVHLFMLDPAIDPSADPTGQARRLLSRHDVPVEDNAPAWSPDGEWIAFRRKELAGPGMTLGKQLWRMRADGSQAEALTTDPDHDYGPPVWSPDGRYLLYHRFPLKGPQVTISVWIMDTATGEAWEVARPGQRPQWAP
ncbi:MAG TPA: Ig-like domain-containing protein [Caldilineaceae bacterium]|nr:Ig-like domain-containing protein [Caldilineaceae bacterium]